MNDRIEKGPRVQAWRMYACALRTRALAPLAAAMLAASACADGTEPELGQPGPGELSGTVTHHKTGTGVSDLVVVLVASGRISATAHTDVAGRFRFHGLNPGSYTVRLAGMELAGLDPKLDALEPEQQPVQFNGSGTELVFTVVALVAPRITGEVFCAGVPVAGAQVRVVGGNADLTVATNEQGKFGALDLSPGHYAVLPVTAPCVVTPGFHALELKPGQARQADFGG